MDFQQAILILITVFMVHGATELPFFNSVGSPGEGHSSFFLAQNLPNHTFHMKKMVVLSAIQHSLAFRGICCDRVGSSYEEKTTLRTNKVFLRSQLAVLCRGLLVLESTPGIPEVLP